MHCALIPSIPHLLLQGGYVDCEQRVPRVQGVLAVSRGLGDIDLKEFITAEPDVSTHRITRDCEFVILASDGLWDVVGPCSLKCIR